MKKIIFIIFIVTVSLPIYSQSKTDFAGMWKVITMVGGPKGDNMKPTYLYLNADGSYLWGIDSAKSDPVQNVAKGTWDLTSDGDIKFTPSDPTDKILYYTKRGEMYEYAGFDKNGVKTPEIVLEMSLFIQKCP